MPFDKQSIASFLFDLKIIGFLVSLLLFFSGIMAVILGVVHLIEAIMEAFVNENGRPGVHLIATIDTLLFALVIFILGGGIYKLFVGKGKSLQGNPVFDKINDFKDLKILLWETLLLTLVVWSSFSFFLDDEPSYKQLILPASILILAFALYLLKGGWPFKKKE